MDTDTDGQVVQLLDYFPYGETRIDQAEGEYHDDYGFTGKELDEETELNYFEARYYDSATGRFISSDPAFFALGTKSIKNLTGQDIQTYLRDPQQLNIYSYARNNPLKYTDPSGNASQLAWMVNPALTALQVGVLGFLNNAYKFITPDSNYSREFFSRSLSLNPSDLNITDNDHYSDLISQIKNSKAYNQKIEEAIKKANLEKSASFNYSYIGDKAGSSGGSIGFNGGDLFTSIGGTLETHISGNRMDNGLWSLNVGIKDKYDFNLKKRDDYLRNLKFTTLNNSMLIPQGLGVISKYNININFRDIR